MLEHKFIASAGGASWAILSEIPSGLIAGVGIYFLLYLIEVLKTLISKEKGKRDDQN